MSTESPPLRLEWRSPAELTENPANWRRHPESQLSALSDAIGEVGWAGACLFNERTGRLIDGHARKKVAHDRGDELIPVLVGSWDEATEKKILATLDPLAAMAEADAPALDALLREVNTGSQAVALMLGELAVKSNLYKANGDGKDDPADHWQGMPEFEHEDKTAFRSIIVHFADAEAVEDFAKRLECQLTDDTKYIHHPHHETTSLGHYENDD